MSSPDLIRRLSDELAQDPQSLAFLELGETLRQQGERDLALKVALKGLERHPHHADAHDLLARLHVDAGELERAYDEWDMVVRLSPNHVGAQQGMGYVRFQQGRLAEAEVHLSAAASLDPNDERNLSALEYVRIARIDAGEVSEGDPMNSRLMSTQEMPVIIPEAAPPPAAAAVHPTAVTPQSITPQSSAVQSMASGAGNVHPAAVFHDLLAGGDQAAILLDSEGLVLAGAYPGADGHDVAEEVGAGLSGVSEEAERAMRHLGMGAWTSLVFETEGATLAMAPGPDGGLMLVAASRATPLGFVRRLLERAGDRARAWIGAEARP